MWTLSISGCSRHHQHHPEHFVPCVVSPDTQFDSPLSPLVFLHYSCPGFKSYLSTCVKTKSELHLPAVGPVMVQTKWFDFGRDFLFFYFCNTVQRNCLDRDTSTIYLRIPLGNVERERGEERKERNHWVNIAAHVSLEASGKPTGNKLLLWPCHYH